MEYDDPHQPGLILRA